MIVYQPNNEPLKFRFTPHHKKFIECGFSKKIMGIKIFDYVGLGGSFDHLHAGHHELLKMAFKLGNFIAIGLSTETLLANKDNFQLIESYEKRKMNLENYILKTLEIKKSFYRIIPLNDPFAEAITNIALQAHVSSVESYKNALKINEMRQIKGLKPLILIIIPLLLDNKGEKISSSSIRKNLIKID